MILKLFVLIQQLFDWFFSSDAWSIKCKLQMCKPKFRMRTQRVLNQLTFSPVFLQEVDRARPGVFRFDNAIAISIDTKSA